MNTADIEQINARLDVLLGPAPVPSNEMIREHQARRDWLAAVTARNASYKKLHGRELRARTAARKAGLPLPPFTPEPPQIPASLYSTGLAPTVELPAKPRALRKPRPAPDPEAAFKKDLARSCAIWGLDPDKALEWLEANRAVDLGRAREYHILKFRRPVADLLGQYKRERNAI